MGANVKSWKSRLKNLKGYDANRNAEQPEFENVPDGRYDARITGADLKLSKNKEEMVQLSLVVIGDSEHADEKVNSFLMLEGKGAAGTLGTNGVFQRLGYELPESPEDLADIIEDLGGSEKEVVINVKGGFANIVNLLDGDTATSEEASEETEEVTEEGAEASAEEDAATIDVGAEVNFTFKGEELTGTITEILEDEDKAKIKSGNKIYTVTSDQISLPEEEAAEEAPAEEVEEEPAEEPAKAKKPLKKPAPKKVSAPAKKTVVKRKK